MDGRLVNTSFSMNDSKEYSLRPVNFNEYIGQSKVKSNLKVFIEAANMRGDALDHVLFYGPPGLGKTTLASIISKEMNSSIRITSGPAIEKPGDLAAILTSLEEKEILFIDEIHRLSRTVEEILYSAMEDYALDIIIGKGPQAKSIRIDLAKFTLVGATTRLGLLTSPLRDRFGVLLPMDYYTNDELKEIIIRSSKILFMEITDDAALEIAKCSRGTPRVANRILKRVRDFAQVKKNNLVDIDLARHSLDLLEIDEFGLDKIDKRILEALVFNFKGGPTGIETIAHFLSEEISTLEDVYEPFLIQQGFIIRTPRGRIVTDKTYKYFNINR
ncbi:holliday junction DNA helicase RuvB [Candidatus Arthromitus sp. SFB-mouse-Japan]|uniref:Holliday junction branch migration DNA helicase RuvB n=1 Tax=Candidatus Arthromitus sp. SFB-mouse TaxID=49118 RepID=UPI00021B7E27|nr:Holliday junction branch migration DNA helicase RuvB [Candidatus Arthromitus sp. SFB-mouse]EIA22343.1 Holliday junction ATP-dependent DNA helicase ruvB [Candidatus Arthromitus sp. SFB-1]EIA24892.1 Holliday junction ATP-dependent DNA helicase ruvB [Candidatus Arthromitus sp. SFB-2]EIA27315.1 Holliday junction ATP-dependent DNA helicase RuvB [Candidatus Arthromitus sp. SFB-co]EIA30238.1 Holliday junction ATP-dependent DNA helicase ruvB [Candidatus Arthromitus sp. SFB-4]EIA30909.1 Holliday jun